jgi:hypothetical protein
VSQILDRGTQSAARGAARCSSHDALAVAPVCTAGTVLNCGAQADVRGATQVLDRDGQVFARGSCFIMPLEKPPARANTLR